MQQTEVRRGRVTVWRTDIGERGTGVVAYVPLASDGRGWGDTAVIATVAGAAGEGANLWAWAVANQPSPKEEELARWLICRGWSARLVCSPSVLDLRDAAWWARIERGVRLAGPAYGHEGLALGQITFTDPGTAARVRAMAC